MSVFTSTKINAFFKEFFGYKNQQKSFLSLIKTLSWHLRSLLEMHVLHFCLRLEINLFSAYWQLVPTNGHSLPLLLADGRIDLTAVKYIILSDWHLFGLLIEYSGRCLCFTAVSKGHSEQFINIWCTLTPGWENWDDLRPSSSLVRL